MVYGIYFFTETSACGTSGKFIFPARFQKKVWRILNINILSFLKLWPFIYGDFLPGTRWIFGAFQSNVCHSLTSSHLYKKSSKKTHIFTKMSVHICTRKYTVPVRWLNGWMRRSQNVFYTSLVKSRIYIVYKSLVKCRNRKLIRSKYLFDLFWMSMNVCRLSDKYIYKKCIYFF